jgi:hypothetical protein
VARFNLRCVQKGYVEKVSFNISIQKLRNADRFFSFFCAMIAAITLKMLDPFGTGKLVLFQVTYDKDWHGYELVPFLFLGLFGVRSPTASCALPC